jgi:hypothetical protein
MHQKHALTGEDARQVIEELRKEHLLAAEVATLEFPPEDLFAESGDSGDASRSLPRAESFALAKRHSQQSAPPISGELTADITPQDPAGLATDQDPDYPVPAADPQDSEGGVLARTTSETYAENGEQLYDPDSTAAGEGIAPVGRTVAEPRTAGPNRRWVWATLLVLLAGLLFAVLVEKDFRDRLISFMHVVPNKVDHNPVGIPSSPPEKVDAPDDMDSAVRTMTPQQTRSSVSGRSGIILVLPDDPRTR